MTQIKDLTLVLASNDSRSRNLEQEIRKRVKKLITIEYDPVPFFHKYAAALLTYHPDKSVWWTRYQWHPLVQSGRRLNLMKALKNINADFDVLLMWGSWFHPFKNTEFSEKPFYYYVDQSCNKRLDELDPVDAPALDAARIAFNKQQRKSYDDCRKVFCMSQWTRAQTLESHDISTDKVSAVGWGPIGINLLEEELGDSRAENLVLFVGNEFLRKGMDFLREAIPFVAREVPDVKFVIVGQNADGFALEPHENMKATGLVSNIEELKQLYRRASMLVLPHRFERAGHVIIEAMSAGLPIVTSNQGGPAEVVHHGKNGFLVEVGDVDGLVKSIVRLLTDKATSKSFGEYAKSVVRQGYTWDRIAEKMLHEILGSMEAK